MVKREKKNFNEAKKIYFDNFGSYITMKKNGEYSEYNKYNVSKALEYEWSIKIKDNLLMDIVDGKNLIRVINLANINLPENQIIDAFEMLAKSKLRNEIENMIEKLKPLFDNDLYNKIIVKYKQSGDDFKT